MNSVYTDTDCTDQIQPYFNGNLLPGESLFPFLFCCILILDVYTVTLELISAI